MSDDTTTDPRVEALIARVRQLLSEPSTPVTWEADHSSIVCDFPRQTMLEAIKSLLAEPPPQHASAASNAELAAIRELLERPHPRTVAAGITQGAPVRESIARLLTRLRFDHDERCSVVMANLQDARARLAEALAGWESELDMQDASVTVGRRHAIEALRAGRVPPASDLERRLARAEQAASTYHAWLRVLANDWSDGRARAVAAGHAVTGLGGEFVARLVDQPWREAFPLPTVGTAPGHLLADSAVSEPPSLPTNPAAPALDLDRLEATARAAQAMAPGPYTVDWLDFDDESGHVGRGIYDITDANKEQVVCGDNGVYPPRGALAEHIAGTSPDVVLRLIALARAGTRPTALPQEVCPAALRVALTEALDKWSGWDVGVGHGHHAGRIAELRKLTAAPSTIDSGAIPRRGPGRADCHEQTPPGAGPANQEPATARSATFTCGWELCRTSVTLVLPEAGDRPEEDDPSTWCPKCPRCLRRMDLAPPPSTAPEPPISAFDVNVGQALIDAIPVLEAAIGVAEREHKGWCTERALAKAVRTFGGGGPEGIERADDRMTEWRGIAAQWSSLVAALRPLVEANEAGQLEHIVDPGAKDADAQRERVVRAASALRWFVGLEPEPPALDPPAPIGPEVLAHMDKLRSAAERHLTSVLLAPQPAAFPVPVRDLSAALLAAGASVAENTRPMGGVAGVDLPPLQRLADAAASAASEDTGLRLEGRVGGRKLVLEDGQGHVHLERHKLYCLTPVGSQGPLAAAAALIRAIAKEHGPGRLWWAGPGVVHYLGGDGSTNAVSQWMINGVPHVVLATYYFHAPPARRWEDETSG